jgi:hypothetical protein
MPIPLVALILALPATPPASVTVLAAPELARLSGCACPDGLLQLAPGEHASIELCAPVPCRSLGLGWLGELGAAELELFGPADQCLAREPLFEAEDLASPAFDGGLPGATRRASGLVHAYDGPVERARLLLHGPARLSALRFVWIAPPAQALVAPRSSPAPADAAYPKPPVYDRASWGALAPSCSPGYCNTTHVAVHHSASTSDFDSTSWAQCAANVKSIQTYHMFGNGWCDIGYNYLVCKHGDNFEGRAGGDNVKGAHDGYNCGSMGVCLMGYFHPPYNQSPTAQSLDALEELGAWKCAQQGIDPLGSAYYAGYGGVKPSVYGHKDVGSTACPGDLVYAQLPAIRNAIDDKLTGGGGSAGVLKGILYDAALGTGAPVAGGMVALASGAFVKSSPTGYFEFSLPSGTYAFAACAPGYLIEWSSETVTSGDVWESLGLTAASLPQHALSKISATAFQATVQGDAGAPVYLGWGLEPGIPPADFASIGLLWPDPATLHVFFAGSVPVGGTLALSLQAPYLPGLALHTQALVVKSGVLKLSNGAAFLVQ